MPKFYLVFMLISSCLSRQLIASLLFLSSISATAQFSFAKNENDSLVIANLVQQSKDSIGSPTKALLYALRAKNKAEEINDTALVALAESQIAIVFYYQGELENSKKHMQSAYDWYALIDSKKGIATTLNGLGVIHFDQGKLKEALQFYLKSLAIKEELNDEKGITMLLNNIGNVYKDIGNFSKSLEYYQFSVAKAKKIKDAHSLAMTYNNLGLLYHDRNNYTTALDYYERSLVIKDSIDDRHGEAMTLNNIGLTLEKTKHFEEALMYYEKSLKIKEDIEDKNGIAMTLINMASVYSLQHKYYDAILLLERSKTIAKSIKAYVQLRDVYYKLYEVYSAKKDPELALENLKNYIQIKDSMLTEQGLSSMSEMQARYENKKKELEIANLHNKNYQSNLAIYKKEAEYRSQKKLVFGLLIATGVLVSISFLLFHYYRLHKKSNTKVLESLKEKEVLLREIHHRVKNNFQLISSLINLQSNTISDEVTKAELDEIKNRIWSMSMVHQKLYLSDTIATVNFEDYLHSLVKELKTSLNRRGSVIEVVIDAKQVFLDIQYSIPLGLIVNELLTNSLKYAFPNRDGKIEISIHKLDDIDFHFHYKDNGVGLPTDFNLENTTGIGLTLVKILSEQLDGDIQIKTENGTQFSFNFKAKTP